MYTAWYLVVVKITAMIVIRATMMVAMTILISAMLNTCFQQNKTQHRQSCTTGYRVDTEQIEFSMKVCYGDVTPAGAWPGGHVPV